MPTGENQTKKIQETSENGGDGDHIQRQSTANTSTKSSTLLS